MTTEALKSTNLTNLDSIPPTAATQANGGPAVLRTTDGSVAPTNGDTAGSTYQLVRLPSTAKLKHAYIKLDAAVTTFTGDIGFYYSTSTTDGTPAASQGTKVNGNTGSQLLGAAVALAAVVTPTDRVGSVVAANYDLPLWKACGLTSDPGGFFDLVITTTATTSGTPIVLCEAQYVD